MMFKNTGKIKGFLEHVALLESCFNRGFHKSLKEHKDENTIYKAKFQHDTYILLSAVSQYLSFLADFRK